MSGLNDILNNAKKTVGKVEGSIGSFFTPKTYTYTYEGPDTSFNTKKFADSLASVETGGVSALGKDPYSYSRPSGSTFGKALGKYQVLEDTLKNKSIKLLGRNVTSQEFLSNPRLQDQFIYNYANDAWKQGFTPQQIADNHNNGIKYSDVPGSKKYQSNDYVSKFSENYDANYGAGNINLNNRPQVKNSDGSISTVLSTSFNQDGKEVLVPRVMDDGTIVSPQEAWSNYLKTGKYLGKFDTVKEANNYAQRLHDKQAKKINK